MTARMLWIAANLVNVGALAVILAIFRRRYLNAAGPLAEGVRVPESVSAQRKLNATSALIDIVFYALLMALGLALIAGAVLWPRFVDGPVPGVIPGGTIAFGAIYLGKAAAKLWEAWRREAVVELAEAEAKAASMFGR